MRTLTPLVAVSLLSACMPAADAYRRILPDQRLLVQQPADSSGLLRAVGDPSEYAALTRRLVTDNNVQMGFVLALVDAITESPPSWSNDDETEVSWEPWLHDGVYGRLWVLREPEGGHRWAVQMRPQASDESATLTVLGGEVDPGATDLASAGRFVLDLTALDTLGLGDGTTGSLAVDYDLREDGATTSVFLGDIATANTIPADAATHFTWDEGLGGALDVTVQADLSSPPNDVDETLIIRSQWDDRAAGRADAYLTGGDFGQLTFTETECWDSTLRVQYFQNNFALESEGDATDCVFEAPAAPTGE